MILSFIFILALNRFADCFLKLDKVYFNSDLSFGKLTVDLTNLGNKSFLGGTFEQFREITQEYMAIIVYTPEDENDNEYRRVAFRTTIDLCTFSLSQKRSFLAEAFKHHLRDNTDFEFACPFKKRNYTINKFQVTDKFFPFFQVKVAVNGTTRGIVKGSRGLKYIYSWKFFVTFMRGH